MRVIFSVTKNPLNPTDSTDVYTVDVPDGETITINGWIAKNLEPLARVASVVNTINGCSLSKAAMENAYVLPDKWDDQLQDGDCVLLSPAVGLTFFGFLIYALISVVVGIGLGLLFRQSADDGTGTQSVYSLSGLKNEMRKGKPVEYQCGKLKRFPAQWAKPYSIYKDNKQWLYAQLCLGIGHFDIEDLSQAGLEAVCGFEDTPLTNYDDYTLRLYTKGDAPLLFDNNVVTSSEVDGLDMYATNQYKTEDDDWDRSQDGEYSDWYVANDYGTTASKLLFDFVFPSGIYARKSGGDKHKDTEVTWQLQYRSFTYSNGVKVVGETHTKAYSIKGWYPNAVRRTMEISVGGGAWEARVRRTNDIRNAIIDGRGADKIQWNALRAVLPSLTSITEDVTVLMLKIKASNKLTSAASVRFYSIPTAKKPTYDAEAGTWDDDNPVATRNAALSFCDFMRNKYCGNYPDKYLDMENISEWITWCDENECWFDYVFDESQDVQTQLEIITRVMRCSLWIKNNKLRLVRDEAVSIPLAVHTKENIVAGSVKVQYSAPKESDYDGYSCEFTNTDTWDTDTVIAKLADEDGSNPETLNISGITDRTRVWRQAMYERLIERYRNKVITYETTDMTAAALSVYSPIYFNHPLLSGRGVSAGIESIDGTTIVLNQNVRLNTDEGVTNNLFIMSPSTGGVLSVHACSYADSESGDYHTLTLDTAPDTTGMVFNDPQALPICCIGAGSNYAALVQVSKITPKDSTVELEVFPYDARIFAYDTQYPDTVANNVIPETIPDAPENVVIEPYNETTDNIQISWDAVSGFTNYFVQYSDDGGETWNTVSASTTATSILLGIYMTGTLQARVGVVLNGNVYHWGYSDSVYFPSSLTEYVWVSSDDYVPASSDDYVMSAYGDES